ncbi:hypothetical protein DL93DRAFT_2076193 [Clavulina sp. PMI_390]|nr:hypothetical protein DL93DRAFT_2076193 [Clavulina sp. PMI_390]
MSSSEYIPSMPGGVPYGEPSTTPPHTPIRGRPITPIAFGFEAHRGSPFDAKSPESPGTVVSGTPSPSASPFSRPNYMSQRRSNPFLQSSASGRPPIGFSSSLSHSTVAGVASNGSISIRADPTISTSFDPSDKELYALWAPKT